MSTKVNAANMRNNKKPHNKPQTEIRSIEDLRKRYKVMKDKETYDKGKKTYNKGKNSSHGSV